jgi:hypothetical protein
MHRPSGRSVSYASTISGIEAVGASLDMASSCLSSRALGTAVVTR